MGVVDGLSKARMLAIEAASVIGGSISSGHLILTKHDGSTIDAGNVVGPAASISNGAPSGPIGGQMFFDTANLAGLTDLMAGKNPSTSVANWTAYGYGYDTAVGFSTVAGAVRLSWGGSAGNHFAGIALTGLSPGESYLGLLKVRVPALSPDIQFTVGYKTSGHKMSLKDNDVTLLLAFTADDTSAVFGVEAQGITGYCDVKGMSVYVANQRGFPNYIWDGSGWVETMHAAQKGDIYSRVNTFGDQTISGNKTFTGNLKQKSFIFELGNSGTTADSAEVRLYGGDAGAGGGGGAIEWFKNLVSKWRIYTLGGADGNLYFRDTANNKMVAYLVPGGAGASKLTVTDNLDVGANATVYGGLSAAQMLFTKSVDISGTNLNSIVQAGQYNGNSMTNAPDSNWWYVEVLMHSNFAGATPTYMVQRATSLTNGTPVVYQRAMLGAGSWTAWYRIDYATTPWTNVTFENSWANYGAPFQTAQYRKVGDEVQLRGLIRNGTNNVAMFTLPAGYRPPADMLFTGIHNVTPTWTSGAASAGTAHTHAQAQPTAVGLRINVLATGVVQHYSSQGVAYVDLSGIRFSTSA